MSVEAEERTLDRIIAKMRARKVAILRFAREHDGRTFEVLTDEHATGVSRVIVSPSLECAGGWRLTRFDTFEGVEVPCGHTELGCYEDAVELAVVDYKADLTRATFADGKG